jgi:hypothetical protein
VNALKETSHQGGQMTKKLVKQVIFKDKSSLPAAWEILLEQGDKYLRKPNLLATNVIIVAIMPEIVQIIMR